jgi:myo-inositol-1(or 4)-monophosphatase
MELLDESYLQAAKQAARAAGSIQLEGQAGRKNINHKGRFDLVTDIDHRCEVAIVEVLKDSFPDSGFLTEESPPQDVKANEVWIIDPLDGTTNYVHGYPAFCCTIALKRDQAIVLGVVYDPLRDELFEASQNTEARLNDEIIQVSRTERLSQSLLATGFPYDRCEQPETNLERFASLTMQTRGVRRGGSAGLDLCYTACGRLDGFWELRLKPWDVVAGAFIVEQAGGKVTNMTGGAFSGTGDETVATNGLLHNTLIEKLDLER